MGKLTGHIFLIGFMGTGKTTVSRELSRKLEISEIDTDKYIEKILKKSIPEIFEEKGEEYFRKCETKVLIRIQQLSPRVVSCGGGMVLNPNNVKKMKRMGTVVLLTAEPETIQERVGDGSDRPVLKGDTSVEHIKELMDKRRLAYERAADVVIKTDGLSPNDVAQRIEKAVAPI